MEYLIQTPRKYFYPGLDKPVQFTPSFFKDSPEKRGLPYPK
jgi:hypothetical protein